MNTPTRMHRSSALSLGMTPLATESTTARATAACAGPNIWTACLAPLMVTLLKSRVSGLAGRFGATTASRVVKPSLLFASAFVNAVPAGPDLEPMIRSMCATSLPSPTSDSPRKKSAAMSKNSCRKCSEQLRPLARRSRQAKAGAGPGRATVWRPENRTTISPSVHQNALGKRLFRFLFEDGAIMLGAEFFERCGDVGSRVALRTGTHRAAHPSLHLCGDLQQIDRDERGCDGAGRNPLRREIARQ